MSAVTGVSDSMLFAIFRDYACNSAMLMFFIIITAVSAGAGFTPSVFGIIVGFPIAVGKSMIFRFFGCIPAFTGIQDVMLGFIFGFCSGFGGMFMIFILISAVSAGAGCSTSVFGITVRFPISIRERMACSFRTGIAAGAGTGAAVLGIGNARPVSGGDAVTGIFGIAVRAGGTGNRALMLGIRIFCPRSVGQIMACSFCGTVPARTAYRPPMLRRTGGCP